jgi:hypothetical protein
MEAERVFAVSFDEFEERFLNFLGDRAGFAFADLHLVDRTNGSDFGGSASEEHFVGDIEQFAWDQRFRDAIP